MRDLAVAPYYERLAPKRGYYTVETEMRALNKIATLGDAQPSQPNSSASNYSLPKNVKIIHGALSPSPIRGGLVGAIMIIGGSRI